MPDTPGEETKARAGALTEAEEARLRDDIAETEAGRMPPWPHALVSRVLATLDAARAELASVKRDLEEAQIAQRADNGELWVDECERAEKEHRADVDGLLKDLETCHAADAVLRAERDEARREIERLAYACSDSAHSQHLLQVMRSRDAALTRAATAEAQAEAMRSKLEEVGAALQRLVHIYESEYDASGDTWERPAWVSAALLAATSPGKAWETPNRWPVDSMGLCSKCGQEPHDGAC